MLEPDPAVSPVPGPPNPPPAYPVSSAPTGTLLTVYTYDLLNHLIQVSMPRTVSGTLVTQTRTFSYDHATQRLLSAKRGEMVSRFHGLQGTRIPYGICAFELMRPGPGASEDLIKGP